MKMKKVLSGVLAALLTVSSTSAAASAYETPKQGTVPADSSVNSAAPAPQRSAREADDAEGLAAPRRLNSGSGQNEYRTGGSVQVPMHEVSDETKANVKSFDELGAENEESGGVIKLNASASDYFSYDYTKSFIYKQLTNSEKELYAALYDAGEQILYYSGDFSYEGSYNGEKYAWAGYFDVSGYSSATADKVFWAFVNDNPQFFFLESYSYDGSEFWISIYDQFSTASARNTVINTVAGEMDKHIGYLTGGYDEVYKEQYIAKVMCDKCSYDYDGFDEMNSGSYSSNWSHQTIAGYFLYDTVVCNGYADTFLFMCRAAGIDCVFDAKEGVHSWNRVLLHDNWYVTDVTWMDQGTSEDISFDYFNNSYSYVNEKDSTGAHISTYSYASLPACNTNSSWFDLQWSGQGTSSYYSWIGNNYGTPFPEGSPITVTSTPASGYAYKGADIYDYIDGKYQLAFSSSDREINMNIGSYDALCMVYFDAVDISNIEAFVDRLYTIILDRPAESAGLKDWANRLVSGEATSADIVYGIANSAEFNNKGLSDSEIIERMYLAMLSRSSDASGKADWLSAMANGCTVNGIINGFSGSQEFAKVCADYGISAGSVTNCEARDKNVNLTAFVSRMYTKALNRAYDVYGLNDWTGDYLAGRATADKIAYGFILSQEFEGRNLSNEEYVDTLYRTFFNREPDASGKASWLYELRRGASRKDVLDGFLGAQEFANLKASFGV